MWWEMKITSGAQGQELSVCQALWPWAYPSLTTWATLWLPCTSCQTPLGNSSFRGLFSTRALLPTSSLSSFDMTFPKEKKMTFPPTYPNFTELFLSLMGPPCPGVEQLQPLAGHPLESSAGKWRQLVLSLSRPCALRGAQMTSCGSWP